MGFSGWVNSVPALTGRGTDSYWLGAYIEHDSKSVRQLDGLMGATVGKQIKLESKGNVKAIAQVENHLR